jgi:eukaryotic-like serine/threonine-protein kinase
VPGRNLCQTRREGYEMLEFSHWSPVAFDAGSFVGPYQILAELGRGGMGVVYRAKDQRLGREVAIKVIAEAFSGDPEWVRRFEQEARATGSLNHPNIVSVFDVGYAAGQLYVVTELLHGETLREALAGGLMPARKLISIAQKIAFGIAAAHARGIIHRDLKPENIYLTRDGNVKILDFGAAKLDPAAGAAPAGEGMVVTQEGKALGTPAYMSPEQIRGEPVDGRSDIFSFGLVLYKMCTGRRPFEAETSVEMMTAILRQEPPPITDSNGDIPEALDQIVRRCLEKHREDRFQSARDLAFMLENLTLATGPRTPSRVTRASRRGVLWGLGLLPLAGSWAAAAYLGRITARRTSAQFRRITFRRGYVASARFSPDGQSIIYSAAWEQDPVKLFLGRPDRPEYLELGLPPSYILAISSKSEMAILSADRPRTPMERSGTLSIAPLAGGSARELIRGVQSADWSPAGDQLAVVRPLAPKYRLEYPVGKVLYESDGKIADPRVSRDGKLVAFIDQPVSGDDAGFISVVDRAGVRKKISPDWRSCQGLAWSANGDEILFTAAAKVGGRQLYAVTLRGSQRTVAAEADRLLIHDATTSGKVLLTHELYRVGILGTSAPGQPERDLTWLDGGMLSDSSPDGKTILFTESGAAVDGVPTVYMRDTAGGSPIKLGQGLFPRLSPDGQWVACLTPDSKPRVRLLPAGAGDSRTLPAGTIDSVEFALWVPGSQAVVLSGYQGHWIRIFLQKIDASPPKPISPEGFRIASNVLTPDGRYAVGRFQNRQFLVALDGSEQRVVPGLARGDEVVAFSGDSRSAYVQVLDTLPATVERVDLETGERSKWRTFQPASLSGVMNVAPIIFSADLNGYAYNYESIISDLYTLDGTV